MSWPVHTGVTQFLLQQYSKEKLSQRAVPTVAYFIGLKMLGWGINGVWQIAL